MGSISYMSLYCPHGFARTASRLHRASPTRGCSQKLGRRDARTYSIATDDTTPMTMQPNNGYQNAAQTLTSSQHVALERKDYASFVTFFRQASPYIEGHRGRTFVVVVPGEVGGVC